MEPSEASSPVTTQDQKSYIKIENLRGKNPTEITRFLKDVCGGSTADRSTIARWASFRDGRVSITDDARSGRPKTARTEENVKAVADVN